MIVEYATWQVDAPDLDAYVQWHGHLARLCREEQGCLAYDVRVDPDDPTRRSLFQAWESAEAFAAHIDFPAHKEMLVGGKPWTTRHVVIQRWDDAREYHTVSIDEARERAGMPPE